MKWIKNIKEAKLHPDGGAGLCEENSSICVTCGKEMPNIWDTVCVVCGDTSCYKHSVALGNHWYCQKCSSEKTEELQEASTVRAV
jgi:hypothetical protein